MNEITGDGIPVLIPPDSSRRKNKPHRPGWNGGAYDFMRSVLATELGSELYKQRGQLIEPIFGNTKHNRGFTRFAQTRPIRRADRVAADGHHPQPPQAPPALHRPRLTTRPRARPTPARTHACWPPGDFARQPQAKGALLTECSRHAEEPQPQSFAPSRRQWAGIRCRAYRSTVGLEVTEVAALASTLFAAVAAGASWANVIQTRRSLKESVLPELHVTGQRVEPSGPIFGAPGQTTSVQFNIYNAGGGIAKGVAYVLYYGLGEYVVGFVAPMIRPGQTYRLITDLTPMGSDASWGGIVACLDLHNHRRTWKLPQGKPTVTKSDSENIGVLDLFKQHFPASTIDNFHRKKARAELLTD